MLFCELDQRKVLEGVAEIFHLRIGELFGRQHGDREGLIDDRRTSENTAVYRTDVVALRGGSRQRTLDCNSGFRAERGEIQIAIHAGTRA